MKRILFIASERIDLKSGGGLANRAFLDAIQRHFPHLTDIIQLQHNSQEVDAPPYYFVPPLNRWQELGQIIQGHIHRLHRWLPAFLKVHGHKYSHCIINQSWYGDLIPMLQRYGIKVAVIHHNYEVRYQMDNKLPSTLYGLTPAFVRHNEKMALSLSAINMYLTQNDCDTLTRVYHQKDSMRHKVVGIFETADTKQIPLSSQPLSANVMAICGSLSNKQTELAIKDVFDHYYRIMEETCDHHFRLLIAGRNPGIYIQSQVQNHPNVMLIPNPERMEDVLSQAGIFICPVNCGSGLKLRIMDGLRLGLPILTHEVSAQGYEVFFSQPWFRIYHDQATFKDGLQQLTALVSTHPSLRTQIANAYREQFAFENGEQRMMEILTPFFQS